MDRPIFGSQALKFEFNILQAVLGVQIVITMVIASTMSKVGPYMSFARWLLTSSGLIRYMHPSDEELRSVAMVPHPDSRIKKKGNRNRNGHHSSQSNAENGIFNVPRSLDIQLDTTRVSMSELMQLRYYSEYQWLVDFAFYAVLVYIMTEVS